MDLAEARTYLPAARELAGLSSQAWFETCNTDIEFVEISTADRKTGEIVPIAHVLPDCPFDDKRLMVLTPVLLRALLTIIDEASRIIRASQPPEDPRAAERRRRDAREEADKDFAANCAMMCANDRAFRQFLIERHELQDAGDTERVKTRIRSILAITSMAELNNDPNAAQRWKALRSDFKAWMRVSA
jgi:hypothetical protein